MLAAGLTLTALDVKLLAEKAVVVAAAVAAVVVVGLVAEVKLRGAACMLVTCGATKLLLTLGSVVAMDKNSAPPTGWVSVGPPDVEETMLGTLVAVDVDPLRNTVVDKGVAASGGVLEPIR